MSTKKTIKEAIPSYKSQYDQEFNVSKSWAV